ncbi:hypothetical protein LCGC14_0861250 [marine sediment metagenome]|uniref:Uncharacterized protein n=1 Tax=marine sediment metagenome TaxID=412755 RepID=A0A0F9P7E0_9ZZZZ
MGKQISIYLDEEVQKAVRDIANKQERSFSSMLNILLKEVIKDKNESGN